MTAHDLGLVVVGLLIGWNVAGWGCVWMLDRRRTGGK